MLPCLAFCLATSASAEPVPRSQPAAGAVIARKTGEEVRFIDVSDWRYVDLKQDLIAGDILRTNDTGQLAILFSDRTQVRLGRNSSLVVKQITAGTSADTVLQLQTGTIWARAERGGTGVRVETPAAAAAIRGTDWTMTVNGAKTSLNVLEGAVQLSNAQGSVDVAQGEGAVASIGQAPQKVVVVNSDDREQMLFFLPPREAFDRMPPSAQPVSAMRRDAGRITAIPPEQRSAEDWVTLAEVQLSLEGRQRTAQTLQKVRALPLSASLTARVRLIDAIIAASDGHYAEAAKLFRQAEAGLSGARRGVALYGGYYARGLADPRRTEPLPPQVGGPDSAFLRAYAIGFLKDLKAAITELQAAEQRFPKDPSLPAYRGWLALLLNDRPQSQEAIDRALALDPSEPTALEARAHFRSGFQGDDTGALEDLNAVLAITPGSSSTWNEIGNIQSGRNANREAEAAYRTAIALDPNGPLSHANLAIFYLDTGRVEAAKREIDAVFAADPSFDMGLLARGRYYLQTGEIDLAIEDLLAGSVANPAVSQGQLMLAAGLYEKGDRLGADQAVDNADRLDRNDPVISALRTAIAIDAYDSESAIRNAQEYLRRSKARGGDFTSIGANQEAGSTLNDAFRLQGMNAWGEYYSDAAFDPFAGTAYIDQSIRGSANLFANNYFYGDDVINNESNGKAFSSLLQGLLLEPHVISGRSRSANIVQRPFLEGSLGGGLTATGGEEGYVATGELKGYSNLPFPISFYTNLEWQTAPDSRDIAALTDLDTENRVFDGNGYLTMSPTAYDRFVFYFNHTRNDFSRDFTTLEDPSGPLGFPLPLVPFISQQDLSSTVTSAGLGWSHTLGYQNVVNLALLYNGISSHSSLLGQFDDGTITVPVGRSDEEFDQKSYIAAASHLVGAGDLTFRYGIEGGWIDASQSEAYTNLVPPPFIGTPSSSASASDRTTVARVYVDLLHDITDDLKAEYALFATHMDSDGASSRRVEPRLAVAWAPVEGQWLRAGFMRSSIDLSTPTLSPIGILGLQPNEISVDTDGYVDTYAARWDAEWTPDFFTAVEYQHQDLFNPRIGVPLESTPYSTSEGTIDRASVTANLVLGQGFGLSSTFVYTRSRDEAVAAVGASSPLPFIPRLGGQVALTWVNEANVKATLAANYIGDRVSDRGVDLDDYWTLDADLTWEPFGKRFELTLAAYNLLDEDIELNTGVPGWGRSFKGTLKVRF
jgi:tetratricopeptide (TPR) repeat protein